MQLSMTLTSLNGEAIRGTFQAWYAERDGLEAQLNESLSALSAYQSHLDAWQQQFAHDRDELTARYEQLERNARLPERMMTKNWQPSSRN